MNSTEALFFILGVLLGTSISVPFTLYIGERKELRQRLDKSIDTVVNASSLARQGAKVGTRINCFHFTFLKTEKDRYRFLGKTSELKDEERP